VHIISAACEAVFRLNAPHGPPELRENFGFSAKDVGWIRVHLAANLQLLCDEWRKIHGEA
jgi:hypothetical protein